MISFIHEHSVHIAFMALLGTPKVSLTCTRYLCLPLFSLYLSVPASPLLFIQQYEDCPSGILFLPMFLSPSQTASFPLAFNCVFLYSLTIFYSTSFPLHLSHTLFVPSLVNIWCWYFCEMYSDICALYSLTVQYLSWVIVSHSNESIATQLPSLTPTQHTHSVWPHHSIALRWHFKVKAFCCFSRL